MKIVFATNNAHKLAEIRAILGEKIEILSLKDIGCEADIPETGTTLEENALQKARYVWEHYHLPCFADDTGLEVEALGGAPGVYSARYASIIPTPDPSRAGGEVVYSQAQVLSQLPSRSGGAGGGSQVGSHDSEANMSRLLRELGDNDNRRARFRTVIALIEKKDVCPCGCTSIKREHLFEGIVEGEITRERSGAEGFGYDPVFRPAGYDQTFAEMGADQKNLISHRARATARLCDFLEKQQRE